MTTIHKLSLEHLVTDPEVLARHPLRSGPGGDIVALILSSGWPVIAISLGKDGLPRMIESSVAEGRARTLDLLGLVRPPDDELN